MKCISIILVLLSMMAVSTIFVSCGEKKATETVEQQGKEYTSAYICPMHCEGSGSAEPGTCPVCNMDYVKNDERQENGHKH